MEEFIKVVLLFFIYSVVGWLWETFYCSLKAGKFVYRGFLIGPYCPIYGFGILSVLYFVQPYQNNLIVLYLFSALVVTILEYITSYLLEKLFHATWWDYKDVPLNIHGRVAIPISLFWGVGCVLIVEVVHPKIMIFEQFLAHKFGMVLPIFLLILIIVDTIYTVHHMISLQKATETLNEAIQRSKEEFLSRADNLAEKKETLEKEWAAKRTNLEELKTQWLKELRESSQGEGSNLPSLKFNQRRILKNFNKIKIEKIENIEELKEIVAELRKKEKKNKIKSKQTKK